jgi:hypothetical protein
MSDGLDIRSGGAVAVDTETLRTAARGFDGLAGELREIAEQVGSAGLRLFELSHVTWAVSGTIEVARQRILTVIDGADGIADALRLAADVYDIAELRAERAAALAAGDEAAVARLDARLAAAARAHPEADRQAGLDALTHWFRWPTELARQAPGTLWWLTPGFHGLALPFAWSAQQAISAAGAGTIPATSRLRGEATDVVVTPVPNRGATVAPTSLADATERIPQGESRIRVERYTMPDGSRQYVVYVTGTRAVEADTTDPFDMGSNLELYTGERSASYDATLAALADAGAEEGDVVHAFGHSQGGMVTAHLALEGGYDTRTLVSIGSPVEAAVGEGTLSIALRHSDDPVAALAGGGHTGTVGAPGSFIAERTADPQPGMHDYRLPAHGIDSYTETARMLDESTDPRMGAVRELFAELGSAASVDITEYAAERVVPDRIAPVARPWPATAPVSPSSWGAG